MIKIIYRNTFHEFKYTVDDTKLFSEGYTAGCVPLRDVNGVLVAQTPYKGTLDLSFVEGS